MWQSQSPAATSTVIFPPTPPDTVSLSVWSALNRRWQTGSAGWGWWGKDRWSGRGGLALSHLDDRSSRKAKFEPNFFSGGAFPYLKVEQRPWFSAQTFLDYRSFTSRKQIAERLAETLKFWRNSRRVAAIVEKSCQPCWIICSWANRRKRNFAKRLRTTPEATK